MSKLSALCETLKIKATSTMGGKVPEGWTPGTVAYKVRLTYQGRALTVPFYHGPAICRDPGPADVLSSLTSDTRAGEMSFADFASEFGYDSDSRKAESTHKACKRLAPKVRRFLGASFDRVASAEH